MRQAYAKFSNIPLSINATCNPFKTPKGQLPVLHSDVNVLDSIQDMIRFFRKKNYTPDFSLSPRQCAEVVSYDYMLKESFYPALQFVWYIRIYIKLYCFKSISK